MIRTNIRTYTNIMGTHRKKSYCRSNKRKHSLIGSSYTRRLHVEALEDRRLLAVFSVDNLSDAGTGSLRDAIDMANAAAGADEIQFSVNGTINLVSQLPTTTANHHWQSHDQWSRCRSTGDRCGQYKHSTDGRWLSDL